MSTLRFPVNEFWCTNWRCGEADCADKVWLDLEEKLLMGINYLGIRNDDQDEFYKIILMNTVQLKKKNVFSVTKYGDAFWLMNLWSSVSSLNSKHTSRVKQKQTQFSDYGFILLAIYHHKLILRRKKKLVQSDIELPYTYCFIVFFRLPVKKIRLEMKKLRFLFTRSSWSNWKFTNVFKR